MAKNRMTFEKSLRDANKKRKAEEKRALKRRKKENKALAASEPVEEDQDIDESSED